MQGANNSDDRKNIKVLTNGKVQVTIKSKIRVKTAELSLLPSPQPEWLSSGAYDSWWDFFQSHFSVFFFIVTAAVASERVEVSVIVLVPETI